MGYAKQETIKKQKRLVSRAQRNKRKILVNFFKIFLVMIVTLIIAVAGAGFGMMKGILDNVPDINKISIVPKGFRTVIYDANGNEEMIVATIDSNREYVYYEDIPKDFVNAFVAIEDERFWTHNGIDVKGIFRAAIKGVASGNFDEGASTLTQQLIKNHVFNVGLDEKTFLDRLERKIQEQFLALELEKKYGKEEIVEYYLNTIYLGRGVHGIQAASEKYFGKTMDQLTVSEIAVIAAITQHPSKYDPVSNPEENAKRRKDVLNKMLELEYITQAQYDTAVADDVYARIEEEHEIQVAEEDINSYYQDAILDSLVKDFTEIYECTEEEASNMIFTGGYSVYSVQDKEIQAICDSVINSDDYVGYVDKVGLEYQLTILDQDGETDINYSTGHLLLYYREQTGNDKYNNIYSSEEAARAAADEFKEAMLNETGGTYIAENFVVTPQPQFSFTIMDQKTGYVKGIVGGRGEKTANRSLNRATDSPRQPGSTFKILAAYLPLFDTGMGSLATPFKDEPMVYANGGAVYNWYGGYRGHCTARDGIRDSMNILAVKAITKVSAEVAYDYLLKVGLTTIVKEEITSDGMVLSDINQSCALGGLTYGVTTFEMTAAYASIANMGVYTKPVFYSKVVDHEGNVIIDNTNPHTHQAMKATTAWQLIEGMKSVVTGGTGTMARMTTGITCAGKTGTTSESYDLWFCGMSPYYTASIWMGFDSNVDMSSMGSVHLTIWRDIMDQIAVLEGQDPALDFERPEGITGITLCKISGKLPNEGCPTCSDYCAVDSIPAYRCEGHATIEFCKESKLVATKKCPDKIELTVEVDERTNQKKLVGKDGNEEKDYKITEEKCKLHPDEDDSKKVSITFNAGNGGAISPSGTQKYDKGSNVQVFITPHINYKIKDVTVNGISVGPVSSYTLRDVQMNITVNAEFVEVGGQSEPGTTEKPTTEKPTTEKPTTEKPTTEAPTTQEPTTEAPPTEEPPADVPPAEEPPADEPPADEPPADVPAEGQTGASNASYLALCSKLSYKDLLNGAFNRINMKKFYNPIASAKYVLYY